jgi:hypothetical protein
MNNVLACTLHFYTAAVKSKTLCELFGVPSATLSRVRKNAEVALQRAIKEVPSARIKWPSPQQQHQWLHVIQVVSRLSRVFLHCRWEELRSARTDGD